MLWACVKCAARRAAEVLHCPHCGAKEYQHAPGGEVAPGAPVLGVAESAAADVPDAAPAPTGKGKAAKADPAPTPDAPAAS